MTPWRWIRERRIAVATALLAVGVIGGQLMLWWIGAESAPREFDGPPRSGYVLYDANVTEYNIAGQPSMHLQSPHIERREGDESLYLNSPTFQLASKQPGVPEWHGNSLYGWVNKEGTLLKLQGPVFMLRPPFTDAHGVAQPQTTMTTSEVTAWPKENRMATAEPAHIVQGARTMDGIGMRASLNDNHLELLDASHLIFPPRPPAPAPVRSVPARRARPATGAGQTG